jgi:hypothetical protein
LTHRPGPARNATASAMSSGCQPLERVVLKVPFDESLVPRLVDQALSGVARVDR